MNATRQRHFYGAPKLVSDSYWSPLGARGRESELPTSICQTCESRTLRPLVCEMVADRLRQGYSTGGICQSCGWWNVKGRCSEDDALLGSEVHYVAELADAHLNGLDTPGRSLCHVLETRYRDKSLSPRQFETLVASIFRDHFDCRVAMTKQTRDGGKDIVCVDANGGRFYVEVKHRAGAPVSVDVVQRFAGVLYQDDVARGILVTSSRFTTAATNAARAMSERGLLRLELADHNDVLAWLGAMKAQADEAVVSIMQTLLGRQYGRLSLEVQT